VVVSTLHIADLVAVHLAAGKPIGLVWRGTRYEATDTPTPLQGEPLLHDVFTHPVQPLVGWRFQGTNADARADVHMFDVHRLADGRWGLVAVYE